MAAKVYRVLIDGATTGWAFVCPACHSEHVVRLDGPMKPGWNFNGDVERPTFSPSVMVMEGPYPGHEVKAKRTAVCHSFVREGLILFLPDCTHELRNQTVALPDVDPAMIAASEAATKEPEK